MTIESAEAEYARLKAIESTTEELWDGFWDLVEKMDKLNIAHNKLCDNDEKGPYP